VSKRAILPESELTEESNDNRIDFMNLKSLVASPTLRETRKVNSDYSLLLLCSLMSAGPLLTIISVYENIFSDRKKW